MPPGTDTYSILLPLLTITTVTITQEIQLTVLLTFLFVSAINVCEFPFLALRKWYIFDQRLNVSYVTSKSKY